MRCRICAATAVNREASITGNIMSKGDIIRPQISGEPMITEIYAVSIITEINAGINGNTLDLIHLYNHITVKHNQIIQPKYIGNVIYGNNG
jgi:hypothetical protein